jgi:hypothetical protein
MTFLVVTLGGVVEGIDAGSAFLALHIVPLEVGGNAKGAARAALAVLAVANPVD